jgi:hypothetical protein
MLKLINKIFQVIYKGCESFLTIYLWHDFSTYCNRMNEKCVTIFSLYIYQGTKQKIHIFLQLFSEVQMYKLQKENVFFKILELS